MAEREPIPEQLKVFSTKRASRHLGISHALAVRLIREYKIPRFTEGIAQMLDRRSLKRLEKALQSYLDEKPDYRGVSRARASRQKS